MNDECVKRRKEEQIDGAGKRRDQSERMLAALKLQKPNIFQQCSVFAFANRNGIIIYDLHLQLTS